MPFYCEIDSWWLMRRPHKKLIFNLEKKNVFKVFSSLIYEPVNNVSPAFKNWNDVSDLNDFTQNTLQVWNVYYTYVLVHSACYVIGCWFQFRLVDTQNAHAADRVALKIWTG